MLEFFFHVLKEWQPCCRNEAEIKGTVHGLPYCHQEVNGWFLALTLHPGRSLAASQGASWEFFLWIFSTAVWNQGSSHFL